jgi:hypothetical protein
MEYVVEAESNILSICNLTWGQDFLDPRGHLAGVLYISTLIPLDFLFNVFAYIANLPLGRVTERQEQNEKSA